MLREIIGIVKILFINLGHRMEKGFCRMKKESEISRVKGDLWAREPYRQVDENWRRGPPYKRSVVRTTRHVSWDHIHQILNQIIIISVPWFLIPQQLLNSRAIQNDWNRILVPVYRNYFLSVEGVYKQICINSEWIDDKTSSVYIKLCIVTVHLILHLIIGIKCIRHVMSYKKSDILHGISSF